MPKAKKLPSGSWRCRVYKDGQSKSFTVKDPSITGRRMCESLAAEWLKSRPSVSGTVEAAVNAYIQYKKKTASPTTIVGYESVRDHALKDLLDTELSRLTNEQCQEWLNDRLVDHKVKSCKNAFAVLNAAYHHATGQRLTVKFPESEEIEYHTPTDEDVQRLIDVTAGTELGKAILLAAFGTLREGECSALRKEDINGNEITVRHSYGWDGEKYVLKKPKTVSSIRKITLPEEVIARLTANEDGWIVALNPRQINHKFSKIKKRIGVDFRFHDLRAYAASIRHYLGIPDVFILADGGWRTDVCLKRIYRRAMEDKRKEFSEKTNAHFSKLICHDICHETAEVP